MLFTEHSEAEAAMALAAVEAARALAEAADSGRLDAWAYLKLINVLEGLGRHEDGIAVGRGCLARARQLGLARQIAAPIAGNLAESLMSAGRWDEAAKIADEVLSLDLPPLRRTHSLLIRGQLAITRGDLETARRTLQELRSLPANVKAEIQRLLPLTQLKIEYSLADGDVARRSTSRAGPGLRPVRRPTVPVAAACGGDARVRRRPRRRPRPGSRPVGRATRGAARQRGPPQPAEPGPAGPRRSGRGRSGSRRRGTGPGRLGPGGRRGKRPTSLTGWRTRSPGRAPLSP
jgi:hypothetical protein